MVFYLELDKVTLNLIWKISKQNNLGYSGAIKSETRAINTDACYMTTEILIVWCWHMNKRNIHIHMAIKICCEDNISIPGEEWRSLIQQIYWTA